MGDIRDQAVPCVLSPCDECGVGNDGLTDAERAVYATAYQRAVRPIGSAERTAIKAWRALHKASKESAVSCLMWFRTHAKDTP